MRILHTEASTGWGGQEIRILAESAGLRARGYDVRLAAAPEAQVVAEATRFGVPVHPLPLNRRSLKAMRSLLKLLAEFRPDMVVTHSSTDTWLVALGARLSRARPAVIRMRHLSTPVARNALSRWLYGNALNRLVTTGAATRLTLIEQFDLEPDFVVSIPTGTDLSRFAPGDAAEARLRLGLPASGPIVGIVGTLRSWKGHRYLISALNDARLAAVTLVIVGDGPQEKRLREQAVTEGVSKRVVFAGRQNDVAQWLRAFDVFALPSTGHETTPQAIQQAMACGIPVVTTPAGAGLELVADGETGLIVKSEDTPAIAGGIDQILRDPALAGRLSEAGQRHVAKWFTATAMLDGMEKVLHAACARRSRWSTGQSSPPR